MNILTRVIFKKTFELISLSLQKKPFIRLYRKLGLVLDCGYLGPDVYAPPVGLWKDPNAFSGVLCLRPPTCEVCPGLEKLERGSEHWADESQEESITTAWQGAN